MAGIESSNIVVQDGNVAFVQPGGGVTVLDAATGAVRLRTLPPKADAGRYELFGTAAGILVSARNAFRMIDLARHAIAWSLEGCDVGFALAPEGLVCIASERAISGIRSRFVLHRLTDAKPLWAYRTRDAFAGEMVAESGRLVLAFEDFSELETLVLQNGTLTRPVRRVIGIAVLDLASGREVHPTVRQDVRLEGDFEQ
jgi:hypothetical protein